MPSHCKSSVALRQGGGLEKARACKIRLQNKLGFQRGLQVWHWEKAVGLLGEHRFPGLSLSLVACPPLDGTVGALDMSKT